jgi:hypothetical protein
MPALWQVQIVKPTLFCIFCGMAVKMKPKLEVKNMFVFDKTPHLQCPFESNGVQCDAVPHLAIAAYGRGVPLTYKHEQSGQGAVLEYTCEYGHHWQLTFTDHSGGTWLEIIPLPDGEPPAIFEPKLPAIPN